VYSEAQFGIIIGTSAGYVREFVLNNNSNGGFQGSLWAACFAGVDLRYRNIKGNRYF
jgi:hypothetical protein